MTITSDWHIHSRNSDDTASMSVAEIIRLTGEKGILDYGITDHLHTPFNLRDIACSRKEFEENAPGPRFHFGVEASCVSQWEITEIADGRYDNPVKGIRTGGPAGGPFAIALTERDIQHYAIEYVLGAVHWPIYVPLERETIIRHYHAQNMFLVTHALVDIIAHPWWWRGHWQDSAGNYRAEPWFDDFNRIPKSMHNEFAAAALECNTVVEINLDAVILNHRYPDRFKQQYLDYMAALKSSGVQLCVGSDCHMDDYGIDFDAASRMLSQVGITDKDLWKLPPRKK